VKAKRIYLDFASATPMHPKVITAVSDAMKKFPGNPSASHEEGRHAKKALEESRARIARTLSVRSEELLFTSGGTESNNIAITGFVKALHKRGATYNSIHIISTTVEHASVLETLVSPEIDGVIRVEAIMKAVRKNTALITLAHVNSEIGTIQPISAIGSELEKWRKSHLSTLRRYAPESTFPVLHADAAQSPLYLEAGPHALRAQMVSYDAQKLMGPKGVGVLYRDFSIPMTSIYGGGSQERGIRPGTENVPGIVGASLAFELAKEGRATREEHVRTLRDYLITKVREIVPEAELMGSVKRRIANNAHFSIMNVDGDYLSILMDKEGVAVSPRSACGGTGGSLSHVILSLTGNKQKAKGTIRFSLGPRTTRSEKISTTRSDEKLTIQQ
jgi:cysteine desulfurase